jgi:hypothetical protein
VIRQDSALLLLVSCPNIQDSDLLRRYSAAHRVNIDSAYQTFKPRRNKRRRTGLRRQILQVDHPRVATLMALQTCVRPLLTNDPLIFGSAGVYRRRRRAAELRNEIPPSQLIEQHSVSPQAGPISQKVSGPVHNPVLADRRPESGWGQKRRFGRGPMTSSLPSITDLGEMRDRVRFVPKSDIDSITIRPLRWQGS